MSLVPRIGRQIANGILVVALAGVIFIAATNLGLIARPASEEFTFGS
jgi:hypothetical protein